MAEQSIDNPGELIGLVRPIVKPIYRKLHGIMTDCAYIQKDKRNDFHKYNYASEAAIKDRVHQALVDHGVVFTMDVNSIQERPAGREDKKEMLTTISVSYTFTDIETGDQAVGTFAGTGSDSLDKGLYKAVTGAIKYILTTTFLIATGDDPEESSFADKKEAAKAVGEAKVTAMKAGKTPVQASKEAHGEEPPPDFPTHDTFKDDVREFPSKTVKGTKVTEQGIAIMQAFKDLHERFNLINQEPEYRAYLKAYGVEKSNQFEPTDKGRDSAKACYKVMKSGLQELEVAAIKAGKLPSPFLPVLDALPSEIQDFCCVKENGTEQIYQWVDGDTRSGYEKWPPKGGRKAKIAEAK